MKVDTAIILAGGLGTRLRAAVSDVPKPMAPIGNKPFLVYLMDYWYQQGIRHFILSVGYMHQHIVQNLGTEFQDAKISYAIEYQPLGTGGGLLLALKQVDTQAPVLVLNGDTYFEVSLSKLKMKAQMNHADVMFSAFESSNQQRYMPLPLINKQGQLDFHQVQLNPDNFWVNGGVYLMNPLAFQKCEWTTEACSLEKDVFAKLSQSSARIYAALFEESFIDIGIPEDYYQFKQRMECLI
ncbi:MAG: phosphohexose mutase [Gammaproteobacteria bacterium]|nr:phosphohexose mutase [Gammaproteobacteria bacterium]